LLPTPTDDKVNDEVNDKVVVGLQSMPLAQRGNSSALSGFVGLDLMRRLEYIVCVLAVAYAGRWAGRVGSV
jgi:hypothetical protein